MKNVISPLAKMKATFLFIIAAALCTAPAIAGLPEPGARIYGTIAINGVVVTGANASVTIEARKTPTGPAIASYQMGSTAAAGNFYTLKINAESSAPLADTNSVVLGGSVYLVLLNSSVAVDQKTFTLADRGMVARVDFGAVDTDGDGMSDAFESQYFGNATGGNPLADTDNDGRSNLQEFLQGTNPLVADGRHPADISPADDRITLKELTDYILAWKTGGTWPIEPALSAPNIEDYVTRAGAIWKGGEVYVFDNVPATVAPLWWTNAPTSSVDEKKKGEEENVAAAITKLTVTRTLSSSYSPNQSMPITIIATPTDGTKAYVVVETPPVGWTVRNISNEGRWDDKNRKIKWGPFFDQTVRTLTYDAVPGPASIGAADFSGRGSFDGFGQFADGPARVWPAGQTPPPSIAFLSPRGGTMAVELRGDSGRKYELQTSSDLKNWTPVDSYTLNSLGRAQAPVEGASQTQFLRLRSVE